MVLSGLKTHMANILGTASHLGMDVATRGLTVAMGLPKKLSDNADRTTSTELFARIYGLTRGGLTSGKNMKEAFKIGTPLDAQARTEHRGRTFTGPLGAIEIPTRALAAEDEFFRSAAHLSELYGLAAKKARQEGLEGPELWDRIDSLVNNPDKEMEKLATEYAQRMRFQDTPSKLGQQVERMRHYTKDDSLAAKAVATFVRLNIPFLRTIDGLFRTAIRHSPLGVLDDVNIKDWKAGGSRRDMAMARVAAGSAMVAFIANYALEGTITGVGPEDYRKKQELESSGWRPNSVKIGDKYISYQQLQPFATTLSAVATAVEQMQEEGKQDADAEDGEHDRSYGDKITRIIFNTAGAMLDASWAEGAANWFRAADGGAADVANWAAGVVQSFTVPAIVRQNTQNYLDPVVRDTVGDGSIGDRIQGRVKSGVPGYTEDLPARIDSFGQGRVREGAVGPDVMSPFTVSTETKDAVIKEVTRLSGKSARAVIAPPRKDRDMSAEEFNKYKDVSGDIFMQEMGQVIMSEQWDGMFDDEKRKVMKSIMKKSRTTARKQIAVADEWDW
jgi:hypothetical protein